MAAVSPQQGGVTRVLAAAKINLCLKILDRRADGYHLLDSLVAPIRLFDEIVVRVVPALGASIEIVVEPVGVVPSGRENLVYRAAATYLDRRDLKLETQIVLRKRIPVGAGLGGGSSDAAAVLRALNALSARPVSREQLAKWGLELGADIPFFLFGGSARMRGVGNDLSPVPALIRSGTPLVVAFPGVGLSTREVYEKFDQSLTTERAVRNVRRLYPVRFPLGYQMANDLESAALKLLPQLVNLKRQFHSLGAEAVVMTGSGSAIFGVWARWDDARAAGNHLRSDRTWARTTEILDRVPAVERDEQHGGRSPSW